MVTASAQSSATDSERPAFLSGVGRGEPCTMSSEWMAPRYRRPTEHGQEPDRSPSRMETKTSITPASRLIITESSRGTAG